MNKENNNLKTCYLTLNLIMSETESVEEKVEVVPKKVIGMHDITHPKKRCSAAS